MASGLLPLELSWVAQYYQSHSSKDSLRLKSVVAATIVIDLVGFMAKCTSTYLVCLSKADPFK